MGIDTTVNFNIQQHTVGGCLFFVDKWWDSITSKMMKAEYRNEFDINDICIIAIALSFSRDWTDKESYNKHLRVHVIQLLFPIV